MQTLIMFFLLTTIAIGQEGIPAHLGSGVLPPGLEGVTDLNTIKQRRIEALQRVVEVQQARYYTFSHSVDSLRAELNAAHNDLLMANLDSTTVKKQRLDHIEMTLTSAPLAWQTAEKQRIYSILDKEAQVRADVFKFRGMWLEEKAAYPQ